MLITQILLLIKSLIGQVSYGFKKPKNRKIFFAEVFTCGGLSPGSGTLSLVSMDAEAAKWATAFAGYQYVRKVECADTWQYKVEKQVEKNIYFDLVTFFYFQYRLPQV